MNQLAAAAHAWFLQFEKVVTLYWGWLLVVAVVAVLVARPLARVLRSNPLVSWLLALSLLAVVALSLAPSSHLQAAAGVCLRPWSLPAGTRALWPTDFTTNVLMYVPLGMAVTWLRPIAVRMMAMAAVFAVPLALELTQREIVIINRQCSLSDIIGNEVGLLIGMGVGLVLLLGWRVMNPRPPLPRPVLAPESAREEIPTRQ